MSNFEHRDTPTGKESRRKRSGLPRTVEITGNWALSNEELIERVDDALHEAGLCACDNAGQFYAMGVRVEIEGQPDNRA